MYSDSLDWQTATSSLAYWSAQARVYPFSKFVLSVPDCLHEPTYHDPTHCLWKYNFRHSCDQFLNTYLLLAAGDLWPAPRQRKLSKQKTVKTHHFNNNCICCHIMVNLRQWGTDSKISNFVRLCQARYARQHRSPKSPTPRSTQIISTLKHPDRHPKSLVQLRIHVWASKVRDVKDKCILVWVRVFGIDSSNSLSDHAMFDGQNGVIHGASDWFTMEKKS